MLAREWSGPYWLVALYHSYSPDWKLGPWHFIWIKGSLGTCTLAGQRPSSSPQWAGSAQVSVCESCCTIYMESCLQYLWENQGSLEVNLDNIWLFQNLTSYMKIDPLPFLSIPSFPPCFFLSSIPFFLFSPSPPHFPFFPLSCLLLFPSFSPSPSFLLPYSLLFFFPHFLIFLLPCSSVHIPFLSGFFLFLLVDWFCIFN